MEIPERIIEICQILFESSEKSSESPQISYRISQIPDGIRRSASVICRISNRIYGVQDRIPEILCVISESAVITTQIQDEIWQILHRIRRFPDIPAALQSAQNNRRKRRVTDACFIYWRDSKISRSKITPY